MPPVFDGKIDVAPFFQMRMLDKDDPRLPQDHHDRYVIDGHAHKCCCDGDSCKVFDLATPNSCDGSTFGDLRDRDGCGCLAGFGWKSFHKINSGVHASFSMCRVRVGDALQTFKKSSEQELQQALQEAARKRIMTGPTGEWVATYGECPTTCGRGKRQKVNMRPSEEVRQAPGAPPAFPEEIECKEIASCNYKCNMADGCGWGTVSCVDGSGAQGTFCTAREVLDPTFPSPVDYRLDSCYQECAQPQGLKSLCAVSSNHLDEQYGSLAKLIKNTCFDGDAEKPDIVAVMTQELNHASSNPLASDDFPSLVSGNSLSGYVRVGVCAPPMSANTALYVKHDLSSRVFSERTTCKTMKSECGWTNCKGNSIMTVYTTSGAMVVGNWHGARGPTVSKNRMREFEEAAGYISSVKPFRGRKHVVWGGDTNVRSAFPDGYQPPKDDQTPEEIGALIRTDVLGTPGWSVDDHLSGRVGLNATVQAQLQESPLKQALDWNKLCPTYMKSNEAVRLEEVQEWTGEYETVMFGFRRKKMITVTYERPNLACRTPADQLAGGSPKVEYLSFARPSGKSSRAPSWTDRIFLSEPLHGGCGKLMKDIRNKQDDHDPVFVRCSLSA